MWQPLFATIDDGIGTRTSHSLRGKVESIRYNLESHFGNVLSVSSHSGGNDYLNKLDNRIRECTEKINKWREKNNQKKMGYWEECLKQTKAKYTEEDKHSGVSTGICIQNNPKMTFDINTPDVNISIKSGKLIFDNTHTNELKKMKEDIENEITKRCAEQL